VSFLCLYLFSFYLYSTYDLIINKYLPYLLSEEVALCSVKPTVHPLCNAGYYNLSEAFVYQKGLMVVPY